MCCDISKRFAAVSKHYTFISVSFHHSFVRSFHSHINFRCACLSLSFFIGLTLLFVDTNTLWVRAGEGELLSLLRWLALVDIVRISTHHHSSPHECPPFLPLTRKASHDFSPFEVDLHRAQQEKGANDVWFFSSFFCMHAAACFCWLVCVHMYRRRAPLFFRYYSTSTPLYSLPHSPGTRHTHRGNICRLLYVMYNGKREREGDSLVTCFLHLPPFCCL